MNASQAPDWLNPIVTQIRETGTFDLVEVKLLGDGNSGCYGDVVVEWNHDALFLSWSSHRPTVRLIYDNFVFEEVEKSEIYAATMLVASGKIIFEQRGCLLKWCRVVLSDGSDLLLKSDWVRFNKKFRYPNIH